jgi:Uncharacterized conserved protein (DUF2358)
MLKRLYLSCCALALTCWFQVWSVQSWAPTDGRRSRMKWRHSNDLRVGKFSAHDRLLAANRNEDDNDAGALNPLTKASWYAVEAFGKFFGSATKSPQDESSDSAEYSLDVPPSSVDETLARLQADNQREYFLSGQVDKLIYDPDCVFADPFVEFRGRDRFVENLENLGSFITEYSARPLAYKVNDNIVDTKFMVKLRLNLPWKPVLAWPWGVRCEIDKESNLGTCSMPAATRARLQKSQLTNPLSHSMTWQSSCPTQRDVGH